MWKLTVALCTMISVWLALPQPLTAQTCRVPLDVTGMRDSLNEILAAGEVTNEVADFGVAAPKMLESPVADGVISPDEYANSCFISFADHLNPGNVLPDLDTIDGTGDADLSLNLHMAHTNEYLFLAFEVTDQVLDLDSGVNPFTNDSVQLYFNPDLVPDDFNRETVGALNNFEGWYLLADAAGDGNVRFNNRLSGALSLNSVADPPPVAGEAYSAGLPSETGWVLEWQIPLASLDTVSDEAATITPAETGDVMLFNFVIVDNDIVGSSAQDTQATLWIDPNDPRTPFNGGEHVWLVPLQLTEGISGILGDVNNDGLVDTADIDELAAAIRAQTQDVIYDLDGNGEITIDDHAMLINDILNTYYGDSNLDLEFSSRDLVTVFTVGEYEDEIAENSTWADGDWNGDGEFSSSDFVLAFTSGGYEQGPRLAVASVPEPAGTTLCLLGILGLSCVRRSAVLRSMHRSDLA
ncbi:MAG: hypothetical protein KDB23_24990 [Planctomycetales bacterium]|nr:hypothetical protein [Planctomycetales bacterium]